jgi:hypothetical protein
MAYLLLTLCLHSQLYTLKLLGFYLNKGPLSGEG